MGETDAVGKGVTNNRAKSRYELDVDGHLAICDYRIEGGRIIFPHTLVPRAIGGRGVGWRLVTAALDDAERQGLTVVPQCWFVAEVMEKRNAGGS